MQIISSLYVSLKMGIAIFLRTWKKYPLRRRKRNKWVRKEALIYIIQKVINARSKKSKNQIQDKVFSSFFRAIDPSRANLKHKVMPPTSQNSHLIPAQPHVVCFHQLAHGGKHRQLRHWCIWAWWRRDTAEHRNSMCAFSVPDVAFLIAIMVDVN